MEGELTLSACMQLLIGRKKEQQGRSREDLIAQHVRAQVLDANGLCPNPASITN